VRPDGGYLLLGYEAYPNADCPTQPWVMAVSAGGEAEWAHRVWTCGSPSDVRFGEDGSVAIAGRSLTGQDAVEGGWIRRFQL
jgi:hypothetical protein